MPLETLMQGAPPAPDDQVTLANWRLRPWSAWAFHHVREIVPTAAIPCRPGPAFKQAPADLLSIAFDAPDGGETTVADALAATNTDALVVLRSGRLVAEHNAGLSDGTLPHILFSVSKSVTALLAGMLADRGVLDPEGPVIDVLPEVAGSAYEDATTRHVLDMSVALDFDEDYLNRDGAYIRYRRAMLWDPPGPDGLSGDLRSLLCTIPRADRRHGHTFQYASPNTDLLGWLIERAAGQRYADLLFELIWQPMGAEAPAEITVDRLGAPRTAGGISCVPRDLARLGEMVRNGGRVADTQVVPAWWIEDIATSGDRDAWARGDPQFPTGCYRAQWYQTGPAPCPLAAIGIHGQWLWINPATETVIAKLSSQHAPIDNANDALETALFRAISAAHY